MVGHDLGLEILILHVGDPFTVGGGNPVERHIRQFAADRTAACGVFAPKLHQFRIVNEFAVFGLIADDRLVNLNAGAVGHPVIRCGGGAVVRGHFFRPPEVGGGDDVAVFKSVADAPERKRHTGYAVIFGELLLNRRFAVETGYIQTDQIGVDGHQGLGQMFIVVIVAGILEFALAELGVGHVDCADEHIGIKRTLNACRRPPLQTVHNRPDGGQKLGLPLYGGGAERLNIAPERLKFFGQFRVAVAAVAAHQKFFRNLQCHGSNADLRKRIFPFKYHIAEYRNANWRRAAALVAVHAAHGQNGVAGRQRVGQFKIAGAGKTGRLAAVDKNTLRRVPPVVVHRMVDAVRKTFQRDFDAGSVRPAERKAAEPGPVIVRSRRVLHILGHDRISGHRIFELQFGAQRGAEFVEFIKSGVQFGLKSFALFNKVVRNLAVLPFGFAKVPIRQIEPAPRRVMCQVKRVTGLAVTINISLV